MDRNANQMTKAVPVCTFRPNPNKQYPALVTHSQTLGRETFPWIPQFFIPHAMGAERFCEEEINRIPRLSQSWRLTCTLYSIVVVSIGFSLKLSGYIGQMGMEQAVEEIMFYTSALQLISIVGIAYLLRIIHEQNRDLFYRPYDPHNGSVYLKAGFIVFSVGACIYNAFQIVEDVMHFKLRSDCGSYSTPVCHVIFFVYNVVAMLFVVIHSKVNIVHNPKTVFYLFTHLVATEVNAWFGLIMDESAEKLHFSTLTGNATAEPESCEELFNEKISEYRDLFATYLYPCAIEKSLIAGGFFAIMAMNVSSFKVVISKSNVILYGQKHKLEWNSKLSFNWTLQGFVCGILLLLSTIIIIVAKFTVPPEMQPEFLLNAAYHELQIVILLFMTLALIFSHWMLKCRGIIDHFHNKIDAPLLVVGFIGIAQYSVFSIIATINVYMCDGCDMAKDSMNAQTVMSTFLSYFMNLVQGIMQTVYLMDALRRKALYDTSFSRSLLTFLLFGNICLWIMLMFELDYDDVNPIQFSVFGHRHWNLITHTFGPVAIFFRFHSTACLFDVWHTGFFINPPPENGEIVLNKHKLESTL